MTRLLVWLAAVGGLFVAASCIALIVAAAVEALVEWRAERREQQLDELDDYLRDLRDTDGR